MTVLADFNADILVRLPATNNYVNSGGRDDAVGHAAQIWSKYRPQVLLADLAGTGSAYDFSLPAAFDIDTSYLRLVEYPAGERTPTYVDAADWVVYRSTSSTAKLRLYRATPAVGETVRITYTCPHVINASGSTIDAGDEGPFADLCASLVAEWVSSYFSQAVDSSLVVDSRDYKSQATEYALRARRFRDLAFAHLGIGAGSGAGAAAGGAAPVPASAVIKDFDSTRLDGSIRLTHPQT